MDNEKKIEIPFGAFDSELIRQEISIPNGFKAVIDGNKIILTKIESEDEKIRKALIEMVHDTTGDSLWVDYNVHKEDALAWLEKQGEQKPADKVAPKFHEGDWVIQGCNILKIRCVGDEYYCFETVSGYVDYMLISEIDSQFHLWIIADAQDGDVLCDYHEAYDNPLIFILKKFEHVNFGLVIPSDYSSYCFLTASDRPKFEKGTYHHKHNIKPATKEQRDLLFEKMKEAGYEWGADKKELKKIDARENLTLDGNLMQADCMIVEQKPAWSEEDEEMRLTVLQDL